MKQSTFSAVMANSIKNLLQGYTKGIRFVAVLTMLLTIGVGSMWGATTTYTFTSKEWADSSNGWTNGQEGNQLTANQGVQVTTGVSGANATTTTSFTNISKIEVQYCTNESKGAGSIKIQVGSNTEKTFSVTKPSSGGTTLKTATFNFNPNETGKVKITVQCTTNSVYIYSITITTEDATCTEPEITFNNGSYTIGGSALDLSSLFSSDSDGAVTYSVEVANGTGASIDGTSFTATTAGTATVTASQDADGDYCKGSAPATITVKKQSATIVLSEAGTENTVSGTFYKDDSYILPSSTDATCGDKVLVGWSTVEIDETDTKPTSNYDDKGTSVSLKAGNNKFYAVFADQEGFDGNISFAGKWNTTTTMESYSNQSVNIQFNKNDGTSPKYYVDGESVRLYYNNTMEVSSGGLAIKKITLYLNDAANGDLNQIFANDVSILAKDANVGTCVWTGNATTVTFRIGERNNNNQTTAGHRKISGLLVETDGGTVTYSNYTTSCGQTYTITWKNYDGTTLKTEEVAYGTTPSYTGTTPTKVATEQYTYTHNGWTPNVVAVTDNATYTATFTETPRTYTITLNTNGGTINAGNVTSYTYGVGATLPTNVTKENHQFGGWFDNSGCTGTAVTAISTTATGNKEYWAKWTELPKYIVTWSADGHPIKIEEVYVNEQVSEVPTSSDIPEENRCGDKFFGWTTDPIATPQDDAPTVFTTAANSPTITDNITFYAVFADYAD